MRMYEVIREDEFGLYKIMSNVETKNGMGESILYNGPVIISKCKSYSITGAALKFKMDLRNDIEDSYKHKQYTLKGTFQHPPEKIDEYWANMRDEDPPIWLVVMESVDVMGTIEMQEYMITYTDIDWFDFGDYVDIEEKKVASKVTELIDSSNLRKIAGSREIGQVRQTSQEIKKYERVERLQKQLDTRDRDIIDDTTYDDTEEIDFESQISITKRRIPNGRITKHVEISPEIRPVIPQNLRSTPTSSRNLQRKNWVDDEGISLDDSIDLNGKDKNKDPEQKGFFGRLFGK